MVSRFSNPIMFACAAALFAQTPPLTVLEIEYDNLAWYYSGVADPAQHARSALPSPLPATLNRIFKLQLGLADIIAVNGKPAKGLYVERNVPFLFSTTQRAGQAIADISGWGVADNYVVILDAEGRLIGNIVYVGVGGMAAPPGAPTGAASQIPRLPAARAHSSGPAAKYLLSRGAPQAGLRR